MTTGQTHEGFVSTGNWFDEFVGIPVGFWMQPEPIVKRIGTPVWIIMRYFQHAGLSQSEVAALYGLTEREVQAACAYAQEFPWRIDDRFADEG